MAKIMKFIAPSFPWASQGLLKPPGLVVEIVHGLTVRADSLRLAWGASEMDPENLAYHQHSSSIVLAYQIVVLQPRGRPGHGENYEIHHFRFNNAGPRSY